MERETALLSRLAADSKDYIKLEAEAMQLRVFKKMSDSLSSLTIMAAIAAGGAFFLFFLSAGLAFFIGEKIGSLRNGFLIVASIYLVGTAILFAARNRLKQRKLRDTMVLHITGKASYAELERQEERVDEEVKAVNQRLNESLNELKDIAEKVNTDVNRVRNMFTTGKDGEPGGKRQLVYSLIDLAVNKFLLRKTSVAGAVLPLVVNSVTPGGALHNTGKSVAGYFRTKFAAFMKRKAA
jgi:hypothetical protein